MRTITIPEIQLTIPETPEEITLFLTHTSPKVLTKIQQVVTRAIGKDVVEEAILDSIARDEHERESRRRAGYEEPAPTRHKGSRRFPETQAV